MAPQRLILSKQCIQTYDLWIGESLSPFYHCSIENAVFHCVFKGLFFIHLIRQTFSLGESLKS